MIIMIMIIENYNYNHNKITKGSRHSRSNLDIDNSS